MASLLTDLTAEKTVLAPGQSFRVEAVTARPDAVVAIDAAILEKRTTRTALVRAVLAVDASERPQRQVLDA